ncbi:hypothetical protein PSTG_11248 [Puccinia striiformis f. sp. tritici PST-78]|uniref:CCHC-type domain-containing protein n=1 Tax=Puccinia striiformis f. sp. tritici PST-78 TaxID=1165861 RepID=A0A0L0V7V9_9BASI|nr:hypothetical protein PSTG_11248 [Puccinia striiformis f. sp. tritici PST-78]
MPGSHLLSRTSTRNGSPSMWFCPSTHFSVSFYRRRLSTLVLPTERLLNSVLSTSARSNTGVRNTVAASASESVFTSIPPSALATTVEDDLFDPSAFLTSINQSEWVDALDFYAITANICWQCGDDNHYARNCPDKSRAGTGVRKASQEWFIESPSPPLPKIKNMQEVALITIHLGIPQTTASPFQWLLKLQQKGGVLAQIMDIGDIPDNLDTLEFYNMGLGEDLVSDVAVFDTGASHGFTGSKSLLHDFRSLSKPIGVSVATTGAGSFITGMGP